MVSARQTLTNPVTGERMTFIRTSADTSGEYVLIELRADPDAFVAAAHVHPTQTETFEVVSGTLGARVAGKRIEARAGDMLVVEPGQAHTWWNAGSEELVFQCEIRPALQLESPQGHFDTVRLPFPPAPLQRAALAVGAALGRTLGYGSTCVPAPAARAVGATA
jgi:quercetin dioxygenase-like cupin family protein